MSLRITTEMAGPVLLARLAGDLDRDADAPLSKLEGSLAGVEGVVLDFAGTGFISSSGLALLVRLVSAAGGGGTAVAAIGLDDHYRHVFEITHLDQFIAVTDDQEAALAVASGGRE